jgi:ribonuclease R
MNYNIHTLSKIMEHINKMEHNAKKAERDSIKFKQVEYMLDKVGNIYNGNITGITNWGVYVYMEEVHSEGMILNDHLPGEIDTEHYKIILNDNRTFLLGDSIIVKIESVSLLDKQIDLKII